VSAPYEAPTDPEIVVRTDQQSLDESVSEIMEFLRPRVRAEISPEI
jgi:adenylylsulfate kinase-like enzyme